MMKMMKNMYLAAMAIFAVTTEIAGVIDSNYDETRSMQYRMPIRGLTMWSIGSGEVEALRLKPPRKTVHLSTAPLSDDVEDDQDFVLWTDVAISPGVAPAWFDGELKPKGTKIYETVKKAWTSARGVKLAWTLVFILLIVVLVLIITGNSNAASQHKAGFVGGYTEGYDKGAYYGYDSIAHSPFQENGTSIVVENYDSRY